MVFPVTQTASNPAGGRWIGIWPGPQQSSGSVVSDIIWTFLAGFDTAALDRIFIRGESPVSKAVKLKTLLGGLARHLGGILAVTGTSGNVTIPNSIG